MEGYFLGSALCVAGLFLWNLSLGQKVQDQTSLESILLYLWLAIGWPFLLVIFVSAKVMSLFETRKKP